MSNDFQRIKIAYQSSFDKHGLSSSSMLMPKGRHNTRFDLLMTVLGEFDNPRVLDYGCGLGFLLQYLNEHQFEGTYCGMDIVEEFVNSCRARFGDRIDFRVIDPEIPIVEKFDVVYASGVFNLKTSRNDVESLGYVKQRLHELFATATKALVVDFLSPHVDFRQDEAQHIDFQTVLDWMVPLHTRRWAIRHDYLPYEYGLILYKDDEVLRPMNTFRFHSARVYSI